MWAWDMPLTRTDWLKFLFKSTVFQTFPVWETARFTIAGFYFVIHICSLRWPTQKIEFIGDHLGTWLHFNSWKKQPSRHLWWYLHSFLKLRICPHNKTDSSYVNTSYPILRITCLVAFIKNIFYDACFDLYQRFI